MSLRQWRGFVVFKKELLDHARDRRSLLGTLVLPLVGPLALVALFGLVSEVQKAHPSVVAISNAEAAPELVQRLRQQGVEVAPGVVDPRAAIETGEQDLVLVIPHDFAKRFAEAKPAKLELYSDGARPKSIASAQRLERMLMVYAQELAVLRLIARGVSPEIMQPVRVDSIEVARSEKRSAQLLNVVPLLLMLSALIGGMNIAIDTTAGERERGSLEPLLNNPISRPALILGKWLTTTFASVLIATLSALGFLVAGWSLPLEELDIKVLLGPTQALHMWLLALPLAPFGAALQMLVACTARTFKEAQTYLNLLNLLPMLPAVVLMIYPDQGQLWMAWVPTLAQVTAIADVLEGDVVSAVRVLSMWGSTALYTALLLAALSKLLTRERIIFGR